LSACEIPRTNGLVVYLSGDGNVWRKEGEAAPKLVLPRVKSSLMLSDSRQSATARCWELELGTRKKVVRVRPLFTFLAVPSLAVP